MTNQLNTARRDEILFDFHRSCARPTAQDVMEWTQRYPEVAEEIRAHAAIRRDAAARADEAELEEEDDVLLARGRSRALNAIHTAKSEATTQSSPASTTFGALMTAVGLTQPKLAQMIDIERGVIADLVSGRMLVPAGKRLVQAVSKALNIGHGVFDEAHRAAVAAPRLGHAKAVGTPTVNARSYEEIIRSSTMSAEKQAYWLSEE